MVHLQEFSYAALEIEPTVRNNLKPLNFPSLLETNYRSSFTSHLSQRKSSSSSSQSAPHTSCHLYSSVILHMAIFIKNAPIRSHSSTGWTLSPHRQAKHHLSWTKLTLTHLCHCTYFIPTILLHFRPPFPNYNTLILRELSDESHLSLGWPDPATICYHVVP